jgi:hypothetical protein
MPADLSVPHAAAHAQSPHIRQDRWSTPLSMGSTGAIAFLALSGLIIWLGPFSAGIQLTVVLHTVLGVAAAVPIVWYCWTHWRHYRRRPLTHVILIGYVALAVLAVCAMSGVVLTWQALATVRTGANWRGLHRWSTVVLVLLMSWHIGVLLWRGRREPAQAGAGRHRFVLMVSAGAVVPFAAVAAVLLAQPRHPQASFPADYDLWQPSNPLYGSNRPFAPSLARTPGNQPIAAAVLAGSRGCGTQGCHVQIAREWQPSAHRYASMDKAFQAIQLTMARQNGPTSTRYCGGCHDPISLFSGTKNIAADEKDLTGLQGYQEGISCLSCHSIKQTDVRGNAQYTVQPPPRYIGELQYDATGGTAWRVLRDFLIRAYPAQHTSSLSKVMFKKPEYCAACHKQFVDEEINKVGWVQLQNQFDNWRMSKWARERGKPDKTVECRECHMPLVESEDPAAGDPYDYNRSAFDGKHRSHRFLGANQLMPELHGLENAAEHTRLTEAWLQGRIAIPEIAHKWPGATIPAVSIQLVAPATARAGQTIDVQCIVTSNKVGHDFPTGPLDMIQSWIELVARDDRGRVIFESGTLDDRGFIKPGSFLFKTEPVDQFGNLIDRHNLWEMVGVRNRRSLFPGFSDTAAFAFACPMGGRQADARTAPETYSLHAPRGRLQIDARLRYRKVDQFLLNYMRTVGFFPEFEGKVFTAPVTDLDNRRVTVEVE